MVLAILSQYWMQYGGNPHKTGVQVLAGGMTSIYVKWKAYIGTRTFLNIHGSPVICNITNSYPGGEVIVKTVGQLNNRIYAFAGTNGGVIWSKWIGSGTEYATPACGDLNLDGLDDIVVRTSSQIVALRGYDGGTLWSVSAANLNSSPVVEDIVPSSSGPEVIYIDLNSFNRPVLYVRSRTGSVIWSVTLPNSETPTGYDGQNAYSSPAVGDIDGDGYKDIVIKTKNNGLRAYDGRNGSLKWSRTLISTSNIQTPTLIDLNRDRRLDVVFSEVLHPSTSYHDRYLKAVNHLGNLLWSVDLGGYSAGIGFEYFGGVDADRNGYNEIFLGWYQNTSRVNQNGSSASLSWTFGPEGNSCWDAGVVIMDVNNDGNIEIIKPCDGDLNPPGILRIFRATNGTVIWSTTHGCYTDPSLAAGDVDGDGCSEIAFFKCTSTLDSIYVLDGPLSSCGILSGDDELGYSETGKDIQNYRIFSVDGKYIGYGDKNTLKTLPRGVYFLIEGQRVKKVIK